MLSPVLLMKGEKKLEKVVKSSSVLLYFIVFMLCLSRVESCERFLLKKELLSYRFLNSSVRDKPEYLRSNY